MVCKTLSRPKSKDFRPTDKATWSLLIAETEEKAKEARQRVVELELALATFRRHEKENTPWPLQKSST